MADTTQHDEQSGTPATSSAAGGAEPGRRPGPPPAEPDGGTGAEVTGTPSDGRGDRGDRHGKGPQHGR